MGSNFKMHLLNVQVSEFSLFRMSSAFNFISSSKSVPHLRASIRTSSANNKLHCLSLSSMAAEAASVSLLEVPDELSVKVSYLINSCGLTPELAIAKARFLKFNTPERADIVLAFFKKHGFTETQISNIVVSYPRILSCNPEKTHLPRLEFLSSVGLSSEEITDIIDRAPSILKRSLENVVIPSYNILRYLLNSDDKIIEAIKRHPKILSYDPEHENIQILLEVGVPPSNIVVSLAYHRRGYKTSVDDYRKMVEKVKEMGFDPSSMKFLWALRAMRSMSKSTWDSKVLVFKRYGWSDHHILLAFERNPKFITSSEDKIMEVMDFLVYQMGLEATTVANWPGIIAMSLEKRIIPRCLLYQALLEKELSKNRRKLGIITLLSYNEKQFYDRVIKPYESEAPEILSLYQEMLDR